ncbi:MAG: helix-turn-helix domain-containing protein [Planctomycetales bacterium]|nr:helix-turn-helix domain-containing protein [Planctomycetales bacterium]
MPSNFVDLNQAAQMLGITPDQLVEMRSQGEIFGFRDGSSWKFKMNELERVAQERGISLGAGHVADDELDDLNLGGDSELDLSRPLFGDDASLAPDETDGSSLGELLASDELELDLSSDSDADSLLVSDEVPLATDTTGSTIIGAMNNPESDLHLVADDDDDDVLGSDLSLAGSGVGGSSILGDLDLASRDSGGSDVRLVPGSDGSDVSIVPDSNDLLTGPDASGIGVSGGTGELELAASDDLSLDLGTGTGDLELDLGSGSGDLELSTGSGTGDLQLSTGSGTGDLELSTGSGTGDLELSTGSGTGDLELSVGSGTGDLELDLDSGSLNLDDGLDDDDDLVLGGSSTLGSDVTLGGGDTGINLTSPSDSGLSLEQDPIELGGPISSLELPDEDIISLDEEADPDAATQLKQDETFLLSPGEGDDDDSESQVIALENSSLFDQDAATMLGDGAFGGGLEAQIHEHPQGGLMDSALGGGAGLGAMSQGAAMSTAPIEDQGVSTFGATGAAPVEAPREAPYSWLNVMVLLLISGILSLSGVLMMDVVRNMWTWNTEGSGSIATGITEGLLSALGIK